MKNTAENFHAGKTKLFKDKWFEITRDSWIRNTICSGYKVELDEIPNQTSLPKPLKFTPEDQKEIDTEIVRFLKCDIIEEVFDTQDHEFISNIFFRPKKDGKVRIILNLKNFNKHFLEKTHFKMETLQSAIDAMRPNCYFGSVDLSEAFYSISINKSDRKYFRFWHNGKKYQFTALIMGLTHSPRVFTKILKPVFAKLRADGHVSAAYIDDSCLQGTTFEKCANNIVETVHLMDSLGLTVQKEKSVLIPKQQIVFLGNILCSLSMTIRPTPERCQSIVDLCTEILNHNRITIRKFAKLIGKMVATESGVDYAPLYYKPLEKVKEHELKVHAGNYDSFMTVPTSILPLLNWWINNIFSSFKQISRGNPDIVLFSDASTKAWGGFHETENLRTGGEWSIMEQESHINVLELKACQLTLQSFCKDKQNLHVRIYMDNTTSCSYILKYGGKVPELDAMAREIWFWCLERNIHLSAGHVAGVENCEADEESRTINDDTEWALQQKVFDEIKNLHPYLSVDLFASRLNHKLEKYVTRRADPNAMAIDAFSFVWKNDYFFIFPPFSLIGRILRKIEEDEADAIIVAPVWRTQSWWPCLLSLISAECHQITRTNKTLYLPHKPGKVHPIRTMRLGIFPISGKHSKVEAYHKKLANSFWAHGGNPPKNNITPTSISGYHSAETILTPFDPTLTGY